MLVHLERLRKQAGPRVPFFQTQDRIQIEGDKWVADAEPEDWNFSRQVHALFPGRDVVWVTRAIDVEHVGTRSFSL
jgi:hypothetical protein